MGDIAASGGYYVSMGAKKSSLSRARSPARSAWSGANWRCAGLFDKLGVTSETISRGKTSGTLSITDPFSLAEREGWKRLMLTTYQQFTTKAAEGRHMELKKLEGLAQGRLFSGRMAVANGLADQLGTLEDTIADARSQAGIPTEEKTDLLILPKPRGILEQLLGGSPVEAEVRAMAPELVDAARFAAGLRKLFAEPAVTVMPFNVRFK